MNFLIIKKQYVHAYEMKSPKSLSLCPLITTRTVSHRRYFLRLEVQFILLLNAKRRVSGDISLDDRCQCEGL